MLAFRPEAPSIPGRFRDVAYRFYTPAQVTEMLQRTGFVEIHEANNVGEPVTLLVAQRGP